jgi:hypothetical protein
MVILRDGVEILNHEREADHRSRRGHDAEIRRLGIDESSMGGAMSAYWFMHDAAALRSLGAKPRTLP